MKPIQLNTIQVNTIEKTSNISVKIFDWACEKEINDWFCEMAGKIEIFEIKQSVIQTSNPHSVFSSNLAISIFYTLLN